MGLKKGKDSCSQAHTKGRWHHAGRWTEVGHHPCSGKQPTHSRIHHIGSNSPITFLNHSIRRIPWSPSKWSNKKPPNATSSGTRWRMLRRLNPFNSVRANLPNNSTTCRKENNHAHHQIRPSRQRIFKVVLHFPSQDLREFAWKARTNTKVPWHHVQHRTTCKGHWPALTICPLLNGIP